MMEAFEKAVREDAPYFTKLNPILKSMGFLVAADTISPQRVHEFEHVLKDTIRTDCEWCVELVNELVDERLRTAQ